MGERASFGCLIRRVRLQKKLSKLDNRTEWTPSPFSCTISMEIWTLTWSSRIWRAKLPERAQKEESRRRSRKSAEELYLRRPATTQNQIRNTVSSSSSARYCLPSISLAPLSLFLPTSLHLHTQWGTAVLQCFRMASSRYLCNWLSDWVNFEWIPYHLITIRHYLKYASTFLTTVSLFHGATTWIKPANKRQ